MLCWEVLVGVRGGRGGEVWILSSLEWAATSAERDAAVWFVVEHGILEVRSVWELAGRKNYIVVGWGWG